MPVVRDLYPGRCRAGFDNMLVCKLHSAAENGVWHTHEDSSRCGLFGLDYDRCRRGTGHIGSCLPDCGGAVEVSTTADVRSVVVDTSDTWKEIISAVRARGEYLW